MNEIGFLLFCFVYFYFIFIFIFGGGGGLLAGARTELKNKSIDPIYFTADT